MTADVPQKPSNTSASKAVSYSGGTGVGACLMYLAEMIPNAELKALAVILVPGVAIAVSDFSAWVFRASKETVSSRWYDRQLRNKIKDMKHELQAGVDDPVLKADMEEAISRATRKLHLRKFDP